MKWSCTLCFCLLFPSLSLAALGDAPQKAEVIRYIAVGDSYTFGQGASPNESWPVLLTEHLKRSSVSIELTANLGHNAWGTSEAIVYEIPAFKNSSPGFGTLMIGVNDWVRGIAAEEFRKRLKILLVQMYFAVGQRKDRLILITIPDLSAAPRGKEYSNDRDMTKGIEQFNAIIKQEAQWLEIPFVDIYPLSQKMKTDPTLVAADGIHPSAKEYALWEKAIYKVVYPLLKSP